MSKFYMLECREPDDWDDSALLKATPLPSGEKSWRFGLRFVNKPVEPIVIQMDPTHCDKLVEYTNVDALIMTKRLYEALRETGVTNLDAYETVIKHPGTGFQTRDFIAANLIGLVKAADLEKSKVLAASADALLDVDFESVAIKGNNSQELLMFRLAENTSAVVIHKSVKDQLLAKGFTMLDFVLPEEWMG